MTINDICKRAHQTALEKGWYDEKRSVPELLCLIHSEVSEALEAFRDGLWHHANKDSNKPVGVPSELADIVIRVCDMAEYLRIDLQSAIDEKLAYNNTRSYRHGGKHA